MRIVFILVTLFLFVVFAAQAAVAVNWWMDADAVVNRAAQSGKLRVPAGPPRFNNAERTIAIDQFSDSWGQHAYPCRTLARFWSEVTDSGAPLTGMPVSQRLANGITESRGASMRSQVRRVLVACQLERRFNDVQMFRIVMTKAYFGQNLTGLDAAARAVFGKPADQLNAEEAAKIAALSRAPGLRTWPDRWAERANAISERVAARSR